MHIYIDTYTHLYQAKKLNYQDSFVVGQKTIVSPSFKPAGFFFAMAAPKRRRLSFW